jgi:hypothetical protein
MQQALSLIMFSSKKKKEEEGEWTRVEKRNTD